MKLKTSLGWHLFEKAKEALVILYFTIHSYLFLSLEIGWRQKEIGNNSIRQKVLQATGGIQISVKSRKKF